MLLEVKNLRIGIGKNNEEIIKNINFSIEEKTCLGILGESGSGNSITCKSILNLVNKKFNVSGEIIFQGRDLLKLSQEEIRKVRGKYYRKSNDRNFFGTYGHKQGKSTRNF